MDPADLELLTLHVACNVGRLLLLRKLALVKSHMRDLGVEDDVVQLLCQNSSLEFQRIDRGTLAIYAGHPSRTRYLRLLYAEAKLLINNEKVYGEEALTRGLQ